MRSSPFTNNKKPLLGQISKTTAPKRYSPSNLPLTFLKTEGRSVERLLADSCPRKLYVLKNKYNTDSGASKSSEDVRIAFVRWDYLVSITKTLFASKNINIDTQMGCQLGRTS